MNESKPPTPVFDQYADQYEAELSKGLSVSGESREYFARGRIAWLAQRLGRMNRRVRRIMDFGCGTGSAVPYFLELLKPDEVIGVDVSAKSLEAARKSCGSNRVRFSLLNEYQPAADIDLVFCNGVFHHVAPAERLQTARWIHGCLAPEGLFAMWDNNPWNPGARLVMSRISFDRDAKMISAPAARSLLRQAGFRVDRIDYLFIFPFFLRGLRWMEPAMARCPFGAQYEVMAVAEQA